MRNIFTAYSIIAITIIIAIIGCGKNNDESKNNIISISGKIYTDKEYHEFMQMRYLFPIINNDNVFPGSKSDVTLFAETIVLTKEAKQHLHKFKNNDNFCFCQNFYKGLLYRKAIIIKNLGFFDSELESHFKKTEEKKPGTFGDPYFSVAREKVAEDLFLKKYPPDSSIKQYFSSIDDDGVKKIWLGQVKRNASEFFSDYYCKKYLGKPFPRAPEDILGKNGLVSEKKVDMAMSWLLPNKKNIDNNYRLKIAKKIAEAELFATVADDTNWFKIPQIKKLMRWFNSYNMVHYYVNNILAQKIYKPLQVNNEDIRYVFDESDISISYEEFTNVFVDSMSNIETRNRVNDYIIEKREHANLIFIKKIMKDRYAFRPEQLLLMADSLTKISQFDRAEDFYVVLSNERYFTEQGKIACKCLGDIFLQRKQYTPAILAFRSYIFRASTNIEKAEAYSVIAFIYEEKGNLQFAYDNYKWILKQAPSTSFATEASIAMLHLSEPLVDAIEYNQERKRQGL